MSAFFHSNRTIWILTAALFLVMNVVLLWRDYKTSQENVDLRLRLSEAAVKIRVAESIQVFGQTFIPEFEATNLHEIPVKVPHIGERELVVLLFKASDCSSCLEAMGAIDSAELDGMPVIGIAQFSTTAEVDKTIKQYAYRFPVFVAKKNPFNLTQSPYGLLIDKHKNIRYLSKIDPSRKSVFDTIAEMKKHGKGGQ